MVCYRSWCCLRFFAAALAVAAACAAVPIRAGGGPENVLLVVNARSWASLAVANEYIKLRQIPTSNVLYLDWDQPLQDAGVAAFRERILLPILSTISQRRLGDHIDYVIYSSDFPWSIDAQQEQAKWNLPPHHRAVGSLSGMTTLWPHVVAGRPDFVGLDANHYVRMPDPRAGVTPTHGFRGWYGWGKDGALLEAGGEHYLLSMALAVTSGRGNTVPEVLRYLERSAAADGTRPKGSIIYMKNEDVRSTTRMPQYLPAADEVRKEGVVAEVVQGTLPRARPDVLGLMTGTADFSWVDSKSTILPGAICEHFTSNGGMMHDGAPQTPLSEFLRYGAAAASGAVVEPYAIQAKFPLPQMHAHYVRGCNVIESFYQAVAAPWQLLIVGDPLCRPWARIPKVELKGLSPGDTVKGGLVLNATAKVAGDSQVDRLHWFLDGQQVATLPPSEPATFSTADVLDGYHEMRVVAVENSAIESQGRLIVPFTVNNRGRRIDLSSSPAGTVRWGQPLTVTARSPGAAACVVFHGSRPLGRISGAEGSLRIEPRVLGSGPVALHAVALSDQDLKDNCVSAPLPLTIEPNAPLAGIELAAGASLRPGIEVSIEGRPPQVVQQVSGDGWLNTLGVKDGQSFTITGLFHVASAEVYQFQLRHVGDCELSIDDQPLYRGTDKTRAVQYLPMALGQGHHRLSVRAKAEGNPYLMLTMGQCGRYLISGEFFDHVATGAASSASKP